MLAATGIQRIASRFLPHNLRPLAKRLYYIGRNPIHPAMKRYGTIQDLYYWVVDCNLDTELLLQNYFSAFYPTLNTATSGTVSLFDKNGIALGKSEFSVGHCGAARMKVSQLLAEASNPSLGNYGSLEVNIAIPQEILEHIEDQHSLYFWDRFYIGYSNKKGQICFVHGVDKTHIYNQGDPYPVDWYGSPQNKKWAPEIPIDILDYRTFNVIMLNRTAEPSKVTLSLFDSEDRFLSWHQEIPPKGVHRFELNPEDTKTLIPSEIRMRIDGMATQYGRPMVFKEFRNGAISAMHC